MRVDRPLSPIYNKKERIVDEFTNITSQSKEKDHT